MTTFSGTDSIPDGEYIIRVSVEVGEDKEQILVFKHNGVYFSRLDTFLEWGGVLESE